MSQGGAYAHNLFAGRIVSAIEPARQTPYHPAHATAVAGLSAITGGDNRYYNSVLVGTGRSPGEVARKDDPHNRVSGYGLWVYDTRELPLQTGGNISYNHAKPYGHETKQIVQAEVDPEVKLVEKNGRFTLHLTLGPALKQAVTSPVTTTLLGAAKIPGVPYENADGSPLKIDTDFFGKKRSKAKPTPGPFENPGAGPLAMQVW
jgi:hypothetical protein